MGIYLEVVKYKFVRAFERATQEERCMMTSTKVESLTGNGLRFGSLQVEFFGQIVNDVEIDDLTRKTPR